ncbi:MULTISPECIES: hypothetical protein [unclassified Kitasatospora]|uniref:hypothetical protein n=1 Tax=unclassified Kitasatospora TaxID=2633591 RepID=UPI00070F388E|nr:MULTISPECIES: hypothetical protein [unclassified Kitasatospora]KQV13342.1 hypothetical protein ASC99_09015 [Kitasatospora sp. Root107]KRB75210.1 hypothetical protein ASE03_14375 [Kitasatospora sp. Root187]
MEFSKRGRLYRRVAKLVVVLLAGGAGLGYWLYRSGPTEGGQIALALPLLAGLVWAVAEIREAGRPFRLRIDELGLTLHDRVLRWEQIDAIGLEYPGPLRGRQVHHRAGLGRGCRAAGPGDRARALVRVPGP